MKKMNDNKVLNLYPIDYPFETLIQRANSSPSKLILNPEFQRKYKWDKDGFERSSRFIESCLMRIPLPACYFAENEDGNHFVIDGVQRITTIKKFLNNEFRLEGLTVFKELEGKTFEEIGSFKSELESTTIRCIILRKENPKDLVQEIFARLNQGAVELSAQEIRHAIYPGSLNNLLIELGENKFIDAFGKGERGVKLKNSREQDEMILRFFALHTDLTDYEDNLSKYLDKFMLNNQHLSEDGIAALRQQFNSTLQKCLMVFNDNPFVDTTKAKHRQSLVHYDLLMWSFKGYSLPFLKKHKNAIVKKFLELCNNESFIKTLSGGLQMKGSILKRRDIWAKKTKTPSWKIVVKFPAIACNWKN
ncbi:DUF262 domain-containing protein [Chitinophaga ginsengisegetis]|uniref:DUF262 domain-containing protein n=1 Tax=Chitinophaga ginsengisegetis TaxID=393003 RepID=UPI000DBFBF2C|nr:DUF262 domain-containing protein [Chitinophaga ginsengisegetis]MDR6568200.1 hypothetical protein [Chitinophaga ginsengisegetis]MDR6647245.1 hypothetical protein [Chitinophaga ginsengisegetis]MDR6653594.1 hypothetical protein [Chitinophaga ginsengisegetis]